MTNQQEERMVAAIERLYYALQGLAIIFVSLGVIFMAIAIASITYYFKMKGWG